MFKTISGSKLADRSKGLFCQLESLARETQLIERTSAKFSAAGFLLSQFKAVLTGKASFEQIARSLESSEKKSISREAVHERVDKTAVAFMISVTGQALKERWAEQKLICSKVFNRVLIEDSSQAKTHVNNAEDFPGHGNGKGKTAGCKSDLVFDLLTGNRRRTSAVPDVCRDHHINPHHENRIASAPAARALPVEHRETRG